MATRYPAPDTRQGIPPSQTIFRKVKRRGYTVVDNAALNDERLSFKALGLLVFLLSKPDDWRFNHRHIATTHPDGEAAVRSGMRELESHGYLVRRRERGDDGLFAWVTIVYEEPCRGFPRMDDSGVDDHHLLSTEGASTEGPTLTLLNEEAPTPHKSPAAQKDVILRDFKEWYGEYPLKTAPKDAERAYIKARKETDRDSLLTAMRMYKRLIESRQKIAKPDEEVKIKYPATWLNKGCWADELEGQVAKFERMASRAGQPPPMTFG